MNAPRLSILSLAMLSGCSILQYPPGPGTQIPPAVGNTVTVELGEGNDVDITRRPDNTQTRIALTVNAQDTVTVVQAIDMHKGLPVDPASIPAPYPGVSELRVKPTSDFGAPSTSGAFRVVCDRSHYLYDDSIVYPGQRGYSHLHVFFSNSDSNGDSDAEAIATTGNGSCKGGIANRSSYWIPAMIDDRTNTAGKGYKVVDASGNLAYYKTGKFNSKGTADGSPPATFILPLGLRMIAGNPTQSVAPPSTAFQMRWGCVGGGANSQQFGQTIPNCPVGESVQLEVFFPQCWDGVNLDSPDHRSHMSYGVPVTNKPVDPAHPNWTHTECPVTHPKIIPVITFNVTWDVKVKDDPTHWRLVTDLNFANPAGWTAHGDWRNGWRPDISDAWLKNCLMANKDCHGNLLGDGRTLY